MAQQKEQEGWGSRERLLAAGERIFAREGFEAARVEAIAAEAEVNIRMLYHHFRSKEGLYMEVVRSLHKAARERVEQVFARGASAKTTLGLFTRELFQYMRDNPNFVRILGWDLMHLDRVPELEALNRDYLFNSLKPQIDHLSQDESRNKAVDSVHAIFFIFALPFLWFLPRTGFREWIDGRSKKDKDEHFFAQLQSFLEKGL